MNTQTMVLGGLAAFAIYKLFGTSSASAQDGAVVGPSPGNSTPAPAPIAYDNPANLATFNADFTYTLRDGRNISGPDHNTLVREALALGQRVFTKMPGGVYRLWLANTGNSSTWRDYTQAEYVKIVRRTM